MSLRRSARTSTRVTPEAPVVATKKRPRNSKTPGHVAVASRAQNGDTVAEDAELMPPPPATPLPNKRRKTAKETPSKPPPVTPTPSAIGFMTSSSNLATKGNYSTGDIDDPSPPPTRPAQPHHTNATLVTPGGTRLQPLYSNFEEESPSKPTAKPTTTSKTLLDEACAHLLKVDQAHENGRLGPVIEQHHCRVFSPEGLAEAIDPFRSISSGIMAQQVSGAAAKSIKNRFIALFEPDQCPTGFPPPALVAATSITRLREAGLSQRKAEYIQGLAEKFDSGEITVKQLMEGSDEEVFSRLIAVRGLGAWSVEMFMCFGLKRMDVFSTGDLGVQRGMAAYMGRDVGKLKAKGSNNKWKYMSEKEMVEIAERFRPYRSLFMWYMWRIEEVDVSAVQDD